MGADHTPPVVGRARSRSSKAILVSFVVVISLAIAAACWLASARLLEKAEGGAVAGIERVTLAEDSSLFYLLTLSSDPGQPTLGGPLSHTAGKQWGTVTTVDGGTPLTIISESGGILKVRTPEGQEGWVPRSQICSSSEFARRQKDSQVPRNVVCVAAGRSKLGDFVFYAGTFTGDCTPWNKDGPLHPTLGGKPLPFTLGPRSMQWGCIGDPKSYTFSGNEGTWFQVDRISWGQGLWFDPSLKGERVEVGDQEFLGDPNVVYLVLGDRSTVSQGDASTHVVKLKAWTRGPK